MERQPTEISSAKGVDTEDKVLGHQIQGGIIKCPDGTFTALRHNTHRHNRDGSWGRLDMAYTINDLTNIGFSLSPIPTPKTSLDTVLPVLDQLQDGEIPQDLTTGMEVEGPLYDPSGQTLISSYTGIDVLTHPHPELLSFTLETATSPINGDYARSSVEIALSLAQAILEGYRLAKLNDGIVVYTSVPESGHWQQAEITPHPYLQSFAPKVLEFTLNHADDIPLETLEAYNRAGIDILARLKNERILDWPTHAFHVHSGVPRVDNLADPRIGLAMGLMRLTQMAKVMSFMLSNTRHLYGQNTDYHDVRAITRRLLATCHDSTIASEADVFLNQSINALINGDIHSLPRYPAKGQHDRVRLRVEKEKKTVESIDASMHPDLRLLLTWVFFNKVLDVIALDALAEVQGDESKVVPYLQSQWGNIFKIIPALGKDSSYEQDLRFNQKGYTSRVPWQNNKTYAEIAHQIRSIINYYASKYPAIGSFAQIISKMIHQHLFLQGRQITLEEYMGIENGVYQPNRLNSGIITQAKNDLTPPEIVLTQSQGTSLQAQALKRIRDEQDLFGFFGI